MPSHIDIEGIPPVWQSYIKEVDQVAEWLEQRIGEINEMTTATPTIAILVNEKTAVEPLANKLKMRLKKMEISTTACKEGVIAKEGHQVRVIDISHVKGLEFEAAFIVNMDQTITKYPDLFLNYLYVGITRAATYFGMTFSDEIPSELIDLDSCFEQDWSKHISSS